ncbi:MAG: hypothetical protein WEE64_05540 [Dehalococcoidia bacterium]
MRRALTPITLIGTAAAMLLLAASCIFGSDGEPLTIDEYFEQLDGADQEVSDRFDEVTGNLGSSPDLALVQEEYPGALDAIDTFWQFIEDLKPPTAIEDAHNDMVDALGTYREEFATAVDAVQDASSLDQAIEALSSSDLSTAGEGYNTACLAVQAKADDAQIDVTLGCAEEEEGGSSATPTAQP